MGGFGGAVGIGGGGWGPLGRGCLPFAGSRGRVSSIITEPPVNGNDTVGGVGEVAEESFAHVNTTITGASFASISDLSNSLLPIVFNSDLQETHRTGVYIAKHGEVQRDDIVIRVVPNTATTEASLVPSCSCASEALSAFVQGNITPLTVSQGSVSFGRRVSGEDGEEEGGQNGKI